MLATGAYNWRRWLAAITVAAGLTLAGAIAPTSAFAASSINGTVEDTSGTPQTGVTVNVIDPSTDATVTSATTDASGSFGVSVNSGTYNVQIIPPSNSGLQSYLATGVAADSAPLTIILKTAVVVQVQGTLTDSSGNTYAGTSRLVDLTFTSPLNPGNQISTDSSGSYSTTLFADQNVTVNTFVATGDSAAYMAFNNLPVGTLDHSQTYNVTMPTANLTVSVRDASGNPITGGKLTWDFTNLSQVPGLPGTTAYTYPTSGAALDANGNTTLPVPDGITLANPRIVLSNGLVIPFKLHPITGDRHAYIIFNATTGSVIVDDQPPVVTGAPDRAPDVNGWYNSPVTITWTSVDPSPSSGTPTTPAPTRVSADGANQTITSGKSCDPAGNCATGSVTGINVDTTPPSVSVTGVTGGASYTGGTVPSPACSTSDALSGVAANATLSVTSSGTSYTATCGGATDNAGNSAAPVSVTYQVIPVGWTTASLTDSSGNPIAGASVTFRSAGGSVTNATTGQDGTAGVALTPGSYSVTMYYASGYQTKTITVTANGPNAVSFATVAATVQINDPDSADLATATAAHAGNTGSYGPKTAVDSNGDVTFQVLPGTNTFAAYDANGYQTQTLTITGPTTVTFATVTVTVTALKNGSPLPTASVAHAGNTGTYGQKMPVDGTGQVTFQVLPGTSSFAAWDGTAYQTRTLTITTATSTSISVP